MRLANNMKSLTDGDRGCFVSSANSTPSDESQEASSTGVSFILDTGFLAFVATTGLIGVDVRDELNRLELGRCNAFTIMMCIFF